MMKDGATKISDLLASIIDKVPYAKWIGIQASLTKAGLQFHLPFRPSHIGNALIPALHGGLIGGFLESSAMIALILGSQTKVLPRIVDFSIDYLRSGQPQDLWAECDIVRQGKRIANVQMRAWHGDDKTKPIAAARAHFLLV